MAEVLMQTPEDPDLVMLDTSTAQAETHGEHLTPFVAWPEDADAQLQELVEREREHGRGSLLLDLLHRPGQVVERLGDPEQLVVTVLVALALSAVASALAAYLMLSPMLGGGKALLAALQVVAAAVAAVAATSAPIHAVSVLYAVRLPLGRLVAIQLCAVAAGTVVLAALAPVPRLLWQIDREWWGPLALVAVFTVAGLIMGARLRRLLLLLQARSAAAGDLETGRRVRILARVAFLLMGFSFALASWAWFAEL